MQSIHEYVYAIYRQAVFAVTSTIFAVAATFWGLSGGKPLAWGVLGAIAIALFAVAGYLAWKDKRDQLTWLLDRKRMAQVLGEVWDGAMEFWQRGCESSAPEDAEEWCREYDKWLSDSKKRVASEVDAQESKVIFRIGDARRVELGPGSSAEQQRRMGYLSDHLSELRGAVRRYLPSSTAYSSPRPPLRA